MDHGNCNLYPRKLLKSSKYLNWILIQIPHVHSPKTIKSLFLYEKYFEATYVMSLIIKFFKKSLPKVHSISYMSGDAAKSKQSICDWIAIAKSCT